MGNQINNLSFTGRLFSSSEGIFDTDLKYQRFIFQRTQSDERYQEAARKAFLHFFFAQKPKDTGGIVVVRHTEGYHCFELWRRYEDG